jgi:hypothetical protein
MQFYGYLEQGRPGEIFRLIMVIGRIHTGGFADGETKVFGRACLRL